MPKKEKKKYKVTFEQKETFFVIVDAIDEQSADDWAAQEFSNGNYTENGDCEVESIRVEEIK